MLQFRSPDRHLCRPEEHVDQVEEPDDEKGVDMCAFPTELKDIPLDRHVGSSQPRCPFCGEWPSFCAPEDSEVQRASCGACHEHFDIQMTLVVTIRDVSQPERLCTTWKDADHLVRVCKYLRSEIERWSVLRNRLLKKV